MKKLTIRQAVSAECGMQPIEAVCCPTCHTTSLGSFPASVSAPVQYGPNLQALAIYLHQGQLLPTARACEALAALCGCQISEGTLVQWSELAAERHSQPLNRPHFRLVQDRIKAGRSKARPRTCCMP
jgi:transposase